MTREARRGAVLWIAIAFVVRALFALWALTGPRGVAAAYEVDTYSYLRAAEALRHGGMWSPDQILLFRTPGYPMVLWPGLELGHVEVVTVLVQILAGAAAVGLTYTLALEVFRCRQTAALCAALHAFDPMSVAYCALLLTETLFQLMLLAALLSAVVSLRRGSLWGAVLSGSIAAAAAYVRPVGMYMPIVIAAGGALGAVRLTVPLRLRAAWAVILVATPSLMVAAWASRNGRVHGWSGFCTISNVNAYFYNSASIRASVTGRPVARVREEMGAGHPDLYVARHPEQKLWSVGRRQAFLAREAMTDLRAHALVYAGIHLRGMAVAALWPGEQRLMPRAPPPVRQIGAVLVVALTVALYLAAALSIVRWQARTAPLAILCSAAMYLWLVSGGGYSEPRMRHAIMPIICILAGRGIAAMGIGWHGRAGGGRRHPRRQQSAIGGAVLGMLCLVYYVFGLPH